MRWIIWYWRSMWCKHEWREEVGIRDTGTQKGARVSITCKKCQYHRSYWKWK